ncbi:histidine kinase [Aureisphaera galaxeae]|uniref:tetratricopeptide repeat-containing sensor histidine kinase n=1 Tax=Aureisphaera galaxeae TaxID=1538023 RepID=UPI00235044FE|nr:histidine kinase [Aureisphaera galaxeae]MDC8003107.1 histidine kinase [Aureisphaera galaxeae]
MRKHYTIKSLAYGLALGFWALALLSCTQENKSNGEGEEIKAADLQYYLDIGIKARENGRYIQALEHLEMGMQYAESSVDRKIYWDLLTNIAYVHRDIGNTQEGRKNFKKALHYADTDAQALITYSKLSSLYSYPKEADSARYYIDKALSLCGSGTTDKNCMLAYNHLAWDYIQRGQYEKGLEVFESRIDIEQLKGDSSSSTEYLGAVCTLGELYLNLEQYDKATSYFTTALTGFEKHNNLSGTLAAKKGLADTYERTGELTESIRELKEIERLTEQRNTLQLQKEVAKLEAEKLLENKDAEIDSLALETQEIEESMDKVRLFSSILGVCVILFLAFFLYNGYKNKIILHRLNESLSLNRLKALQSIMNPHFLFNSFSTLQNFILKKEHIKANEYMTELSSLIREVLSSSDSIFHSFKKEVQILKSYIALEQGRFYGRFEVQYDIDESLFELNPTIPSMIIQPYLENAIIHGFSHTEKEAKLTLSLKKEGKQILCKVIDNGIGRKEAEKLKKGSKASGHLSIATRNTDERLAILNQFNDYKASVNIIDLYNEVGISEGTEVQIILPIS